MHQHHQFGCIYFYRYIEQVIYFGIVCNDVKNNKNRLSKEYGK